MPDAHYVNLKLAEIYDLDSPWSVDRDFYLSLAETVGTAGKAGTSQSRILDLGCGTGLLCNAYAEKGHDVTGVDPAPAMLEVARRKPHGKKIEWVQSVAQEFRSEKLFDLITMTGHAFQVLLEDVDILATFKMMRKHLKPDGLVVFESRNPQIDWASIWDYDMKLEVPGHVVHESRRLRAFENDRMTFELLYKFPDQSLVSESELRFLTKEQIEGRLHSAALRVERVLGDWDGQAFDSASSDEMIFMARAAS